MQLFTIEKSNTKLAKGAESNYFTIGLFLSPSDQNSFGVNVCPFASQACVSACLNTSGLASVFPKIIEARKKKTDLFLSDRSAFYELLKKEIVRYQKKADKLGKKLAVRLNGTSDIDHRLEFFSAFPSVQFYDYTKSIFRVRRKAQGILPDNYHLTFSYSGENLEECREALSYGVNVAVVFSSDQFPTSFLDYPVLTGEESDLRFLDAPYHVIGLKAKGKAKKQASDFVIQIDKKSELKIDYSFDSTIGQWFAVVNGEYDGAPDSIGLATCYGNGSTKEGALNSLMATRAEFL
jgi:hypothetical protein